MRRQEDRNGDIEKAQAQLAAGDFDGCMFYVFKLLGEDPYEFVEHTLRAGRKDQQRDDIQDFRVDRDDGKVNVRGVRLQDRGDTPEMGFGRMGPDNIPHDYEGPAEEVPDGTPIGIWFWRPWERAFGWHRRIAQIVARKWAHGSGSLHLQVARPDPNGSSVDGQLVDALMIHPDGTWEYTGPEVEGGIPVIVNGMRKTLRIE